MPANRLGKL